RHPSNWPDASVVVSHTRRSAAGRCYTSPVPAATQTTVPDASCPPSFWPHRFPPHGDGLPPVPDLPIAIAAPIAFSPCGSATTSCLLSSLFSWLEDGIWFGPVT